AMKLAIDDAGIKPAEVDYINAHGTSTELNDNYETMAIKSVFGDHAYSLAFSYINSMTGHILGAAGGIEGLIFVRDIKDVIISVIINYEEADLECDLDYVLNDSRKQDINYVLSNSLGFGGHNATLVFKKYE